MQGAEGGTSHELRDRYKPPLAKLFHVQNKRAPERREGNAKSRTKEENTWQPYTLLGRRGPSRGCVAVDRWWGRLEHEPQ